MLAVASRDGTVRLYSWPDAVLRRTIDVQLGQSHTNIVSSVRFHPTQPLLVTASHNNQVVFWDVRSGQEVASIDTDPTGMRGYTLGFLKMASFSQDGRTLYLCVGDSASGELVKVDLTFWDHAIDAWLGQRH